MTGNAGAVGRIGCVAGAATGICSNPPSTGSIWAMLKIIGNIGPMVVASAPPVTAFSFGLPTLGPPADGSTAAPGVEAGERTAGALTGSGIVCVVACAGAAGAVAIGAWVEDGATPADIDAAEAGTFVVVVTTSGAPVMLCAGAVCTATGSHMYTMPRALNRVLITGGHCMTCTCDTSAGPILQQS